MRKSGVDDTDPKPKRGFRLLSRRLRFGSVWLMRHASVNRERIRGDQTAKSRNCSSC